MDTYEPVLTNEEVAWLCKRVREDFVDLGPLSQARIANEVIAHLRATRKPRKYTLDERQYLRAEKRAQGLKPWE